MMSFDPERVDRFPANVASQPRREFFRQVGAIILSASSVPAISAAAHADDTEKKTPETLVKILYDTMTPKQKNSVCFA